MGRAVRCGGRESGRERAPDRVGMSVSTFDVLVELIEPRCGCERRVARALARDLVVVGAGGRASFMNDYARGVSASTLARALSDVSRVCRVAAGTMRVVVMRETTFVVNGRVLQSREGRNRALVSLEGDAPEAAGKGLEEKVWRDWERIRDAVAAKMGENEGGTIDLDEIIETNGIEISPPTIAGLFLDFPVVYAFENEAMSHAASVLSRCDLTVHSISCHKVDEGEEAMRDENVYGWSIPTQFAEKMEKSTEDAGVSRWYSKSAEILSAYNFMVSHNIHRQSAGSSKIVF